MVEVRQRGREAVARQPRLIPLDDRECRGCQLMKKQRPSQKTYIPREIEWTRKKTDGSEQLGEQRVGSDVCFPQGARWAGTQIGVKTKRRNDPSSPVMERRDRFDLDILPDVPVPVPL